MAFMKTIGELYDGDRPREKLLAKGPAALKDHELMAVLIGRGVQGKDVLKLSRELVDLMQRDFTNLSIEKLCAIHGMGEAKAAQILAAIELSRRFLLRKNVAIRSAEDVWKLLRNYHDRRQEYFLVLTRDGASHLIEKRVITVGTLNQSLVVEASASQHGRQVFTAVAAGARESPHEQHDGVIQKLVFLQVG